MLWWGLLWLGEPGALSGAGPLWLGAQFPAPLGGCPQELAEDPFACQHASLR